ncbi:MAG: hypothetical protein QOI20_2493 [Acidimicrobiaceae bacterium]|jgi:hypothetical protein|nr:hypothetical protein [Acidimicrobiaceae bacterium]
MTRRRGAGRAAAAVVAVVVAAAVVLGLLPGPVRAADDPLVAVQRLLDTRVAAVGSGDKAEFMGTVDPQAAASFKDAQARLFDGLHSLPLAVYALEARTRDSGDLSPRGAGTFLPETRQRMRFKDYDATDALESLWLTYVQRDGRWYVAADDDPSPLGLDTARGLWDFGPVSAQPTPHFLLLSHPAQADRARALGALAEKAVAVLSQRWPQPWPGRIPLVLPGSIDELAAIIQSTVDLTKFVAFVSYGSNRDEGWTPTAPRIYIQDRNLSGYSDRFQTETLVHELDHAAVAPISGPFVPAWVHEGVAEWVASGNPVSKRSNRVSDRSDHSHLPRDYSFTTGSQGSIVHLYSASKAAVSVLAGAKGTAAPAAFVKDLGQVRVAPGSVDYQVDAALRRSLGLGLADLESLWGG